MLKSSLIDHLRMVKCKHGYSRAPQNEHTSVAAKDLGLDPKSIRQKGSQLELDP